MKLNPDCVRDVMLTLEDMTGMKATTSGLAFTPVTISSLYKALLSEKGYSYEDVGYTVLQLSESGHIVTDANPKRAVNNNGFGLSLRNVFYITPKGHDFLAGIRDKETWLMKMKPALERFGSVSLRVIEALSEGAMNAFLDKVKLERLFS